MKYIFFPFLVCLFLYTGCDLPTNTSNGVTEESIVQNGIEYTASVPAYNYSLADTLLVNMKIKNNTISTVQFNFNNRQQLGYQLLDVYNNVAISYPYIVSPSLSKIILSPNETKELSIRNSFKNYNGIFIGKGNYTLSVSLLNNNSPKINLDIVIK